MSAGVVIAVVLVGAAVVVLAVGAAACSCALVRGWPRVTSARRAQ